MTTMKAVRIQTYGGPDVLKYEDVPRPKPEKGEVLIQVHAAGVNPVDWKIREGYFKDRNLHALPLVLGWDVSGVVEATGPDVTRLKKADEVYSRPDVARDGAYAEYIVVRESEVSVKPKSIDHFHSAAIPLAALTAWQSLFDSQGKRYAYVFVQPNPTQLAEIAKLVDAEKIKSIVETILPLKEARKAHEQSQAGHTRGKIVLRV